MMTLQSCYLGLTSLLLFCCWTCRYAAAAGVYRALAERRSGSGDAAVSLDQRLDALHNALLQVRTDGCITTTCAVYTQQPCCLSFHFQAP